MFWAVEAAVETCTTRILGPYPAICGWLWWYSTASAVLEWRFLVLLLISCGLISVEDTLPVANKKHFTVNKTRLEEMATAMTGDIKIEVTLARFKWWAKTLLLYAWPTKIQVSTDAESGHRSSKAATRRALISLPRRSPPERCRIISKVKQEEDEGIVNSNFVDYQSTLDRNSSASPAQNPRTPSKNNIELATSIN
jgi:hypothetical protein